MIYGYVNDLFMLSFEENILETLPKKLIVPKQLHKWWVDGSISDQKRYTLFAFWIYAFLTLWDTQTDTCKC